MDWKIEPLEETKEHPEGGSTDAGDVSFVVPMARLSVAIAPEDTPWHSWAVVAYGGMSIGHKGLVYATKALAMTMVDLFEDAELRAAMKAEHAERSHLLQHLAGDLAGPLPLIAVRRHLLGDEVDRLVVDRLEFVGHVDVAMRHGVGFLGFVGGQSACGSVRGATESNVTRT